MTLPIPTCMLLLLQWIICKGSGVRENLLTSEPSWLFAKQSCILYFIIHIYMQINWPHQRPFRSQKTNLERRLCKSSPTFLPATTKAKWMVYDHLQKITTSNSLFRTLRAWTQTKCFKTSFSSKKQPLQNVVALNWLSLTCPISPHLSMQLSTRNWKLSEASVLELFILCMCVSV